MGDLRSSRSRPLRGEVRVPGDKSISHRALILAAMAERSSAIENLAPGADVRSTWSCLEQLGTRITGSAARATVHGLGWRGFRDTPRPLNAGNSGTTMRLLMGVLAGNGARATLTGDDSLLRRPMGRVAEPLLKMGASILLSEGGRAPVTVRGRAISGIDYSSPIASAQVKSAVLLAGLLATGSTSVTEPVLSRDHTERMLPLFGVTVRRAGLTVGVTGGLHLGAARVEIPGDASSAAFWAVAASTVPDSDLLLPRVGVNPTRTGFLSVLERMGADIRRQDVAASCGDEPVADLRVRFAELKACDIAPEEVPALIDEVPILALAASRARGVSRFRGLSELRHKESDRLSAMAALLNGFGGKADVQGDDLVIEGPRALKGARLSAGGDHRIAMTALVAGLVADGETAVSDGECVAVSYPAFHEQLSAYL